MEPRGLFTGLTADAASPGAPSDCPAVTSMHVAAESTPQGALSACDEANSCGDYFGRLLRLSKSGRCQTARAANAPTQTYMQLQQQRQQQQRQQPRRADAELRADGSVPHMRCAQQQNAHHQQSASSDATLSHSNAVRCLARSQSSGLLRRATSSKSKRGTSSRSGTLLQLWTCSDALPDAASVESSQEPHLHRCHSAALSLTRSARFGSVSTRSASTLPTALGTAYWCDSTPSDALLLHQRGAWQSDLQADEVPDCSSAQLADLVDGIDA